MRRRETDIERIAEIRGRLNNANHQDFGWVYNPAGNCIFLDVKPKVICRMHERSTSPTDGEFIAHAPQDETYLLDALKAMETTNEQLLAACKAAIEPMKEAACVSSNHSIFGLAEQLYKVVEQCIAATALAKGEVQ